MTGLASQIVMCAVKRKIGICAMIKLRVRPASDYMAILAFFTIQAVMRVVGTMAAITQANLVFVLGNPVAGRVAVIAACL